MPKIDFKLSQIPTGMNLLTAGPGEVAYIRIAEIALASSPELVQSHLDALHQAIFCRIPELPDPRQILGLQVLIRPDLSSTAYVNELKPILQCRTTRAVEKGDPVSLTDVSEIHAVDLGIDVPADCSFINYASLLWKRSVYFDFNPHQRPRQPRLQSVSDALTEQYRSLWGLPSGLPDAEDPFESMSRGVQQLRKLIDSSGSREGDFQELLHAHPWMIGGQYCRIDRHAALDDRNIPDFTAMRTSDRCLDVIELKLPTTKCSRSDGSLSADFHNAWTQVERYVRFVDENRDYLLREKNLHFENAKAVLIIGNEIESAVREEMRRKEAFNARISVLTYDQLFTQANSILAFARGASLGMPRLDAAAL